MSEKEVWRSSLPVPAISEDFPLEGAELFAAALIFYDSLSVRL